MQITQVHATLSLKTREIKVYIIFYSVIIGLVNFLTLTMSGGKKKMTGEMGPWLRAHTAIIEHPMAHPNPLYSSSRVSNVLF